MKHVFLNLSLIGAVVLNSACAPINTQFSCNSTAGDRCLSIEEVNAMTETGQDKQVVVHGRPYQHYDQHTTQTIWMAPWTDGKGIRHTNDTLFANLPSATPGGHHVG